jgi:hypothetical protein
MRLIKDSLAGLGLAGILLPLRLQFAATSRAASRHLVHRLSGRKFTTPFAKPPGNGNSSIRPKSDLILLYGLANRLIGDGWIDRDHIDRHTSAFEAFQTVSTFRVLGRAEVTRVLDFGGRVSTFQAQMSEVRIL